MTKSTEEVQEAIVLWGYNFLNFINIGMPPHLIIRREYFKFKLFKIFSAVIIIIVQIDWLIKTKIFLSDVKIFILHFIKIFYLLIC